MGTKRTLHEISFDGALLVRGYWLYMWEIRTKSGKKVYYVGRTGDSSSQKAQSPFARLSQHLGKNSRSNALRRNLERRHLIPEECLSFRLLAHGPILPEARSPRLHRESRDKVAALEKSLAEAMCEAGYDMLNKVQCRMPLDSASWPDVMMVFQQHLPKLGRRDRRRNGAR